MYEQVCDTKLDYELRAFEVFQYKMKEQFKLWLLLLN